MDLKVEIIGWLASGILLLTIFKQVHKQWQDRTSQGISRWLFIGQMSASLGFVIYSWLLQNIVFTVSNAFILAASIVGEIGYIRNRRGKSTTLREGNSHV